MLSSRVSNRGEKVRQGGALCVRREATEGLNADDAFEELCETVGRGCDHVEWAADGQLRAVKGAT